MTQKNTRIISATPTVSTAPAYSAGDAVGGLITLTNALVKSEFSGTIQSITLSDASKQSAVIHVTFFNANPSTATITDNSAITIPVAELTKTLGTVQIEAADYVPYSASSIATVNNINIGVKLMGEGQTFYCCLSTQGTPTYATITALTLNVAIIPD